MADNKKKRLQMLDNLASAGSSTPTSMMASSRPLRAARDAVDGHTVWELDPVQIIDTRPADRLSHDDVLDLRDSIEATGQTVPILVRRHPNDDSKYLLVYGRRRLEAIRSSDKVTKVRALIASLDDDMAVQAQISENMARRDLSYIEKALFAHELINSGFGNQSRVAEVLTVTRSAVSMGLAIIEVISPALVRAIGAAHGVGRPRWDALAKALETTLISRDDLAKVADDVHVQSQVAIFSGDADAEVTDPSVNAFDAVWAKVAPRAAPKAKPEKRETPSSSLLIDGSVVGRLSRTAQGIRLDIGEGAFADWLETQAPDLMHELHRRWEQRGKTE